MTKELKDKTFRYLTIKIDLIRSCKKVGLGGIEYKDKWFVVKIDDGHTIISFCAETLKQLFKQIKEKLYL